MDYLNTRERAVLAWLRGEPSYLERNFDRSNYRVGDWVVAMSMPNIGRKTLHSLEGLGFIEEQFPGNGRYRLVAPPYVPLSDDWTLDFGELWVA